jgi:hypothetical protein
MPLAIGFHCALHFHPPQPGRFVLWVVILALPSWFPVGKVSAELSELSWNMMILPSSLVSR